MGGGSIIWTTCLCLCLWIKERVHSGSLDGVMQVLDGVMQVLGWCDAGPRIV